MRVIRDVAILVGCFLFAIQAHSAEPSVKQGDIIKIPLAQLHPTQPSIGYDQVFYKLGRYQFDIKKQFDDICEANGQKGVRSFSKHSFPNIPSSFQCKEAIGYDLQAIKTVVIAPNNQLYLTDGHHTFNAFYHMNGGGADFIVNVVVTKDYRTLHSMEAFWETMEKEGNTWLFDHNDLAIKPNELPTSLGIYHFNNDLYRSLMYFSRDIAWNKPKKPIPFLEFYWSKMLRQSIDLEQYDLNSIEGYRKALTDVGQALLSIDSKSVGGSMLSSKEMGLYDEFKQEELDKITQPNSKLDYMLRYKTVSSGNNLSYDSAIAIPVQMHQIDTFTIASKRSINSIPASNQQNTIHAVVEIPTGTSAKWQLNKKEDHQITWEFKNGSPRIVDYLGYPGNYGMIPQTTLPKSLGGDGDPLDVIVLGQAVPRGEVVNARLIGVLKMFDNGEQDDKLIAVLTQHSPFSHVKTLNQLNQDFTGVTEILSIWFTHYKGKNGGMKIVGWGDEKEAAQRLEQAKSTYALLKSNV